MLKLFIRFYLLMLVLPILILLFAGKLLLGTPFLRDHSLNGIAAGQLAPTFRYLEAQLQGLPEAEWNTKLQQLTPPTEPYSPIKIESLGQINLPPSQMERLLGGEIVADALFFHAPMQDTSNPYATNAYQRIPNSNAVLVFMLKPEQDFSNRAVTAWLVHFIMLELQQNAASPANEVLAHFSAQYDISVHLEPLSTFTPELQSYILQHGYLYDQDPNFSLLSICYQLYQNNEVLVIGPYHYPWYLGHFWLAFGIFMFLLVMIFVVLSLYYFYWDLRRLDQLAQAYGDGHFNYAIKMGRFAALSRLHQNLQRMGNRIQSLLSGHQELTQAISHELKTPLARLNFALAMAEEAKTSKAKRENLRHAQDAVKDLESLVNELLLYARFDQQFFKKGNESLALAPFLTQLLQEVKQKNPAKQLEWQIAANVGSIGIAPQYFKKIMENLLSNAFRYAASRVQVKAYCAAGKVWVEVADDGPGIRLEGREKIFEPFVSLDQSRNKELSGHGLGLAIVRRIIMAHHGEIFVGDSKELTGATFILNMPQS